MLAKYVIFLQKEWYSHFYKTGIGKLKRLETLSLMNNEINELPNEIRGCINLKTLQLDGNQLTCIDQSILHLKLLQDLSVSRNRLEYLPFGMLYKKHIPFGFFYITLMPCSDTGLWYLKRLLYTILSSNIIFIFKPWFHNHFSSRYWSYGFIGRAHSWCKWFNQIFTWVTAVFEKFKVPRTKPVRKKK